MKKPMEIRGYLETWLADVADGHRPDDFDCGYSAALAQVLGDKTIAAHVKAIRERRPGAVQGRLPLI
jgi:hypothetical protein